MDDLRWLLLLAGVIVVVAIYIAGRRRADKELSGDSAPETPREAPDLDPVAREPLHIEVGDDDEVGVAEPMFIDEPPSADEASPEARPEAQKIVTLRIIAQDRGSFKGDDLILSLRGIGMRHGKFGIFHRLESEDEDSTIFSAASLVEPGSFDLANIRDQQIPGISLFLVLPGPVEGAKAFDMMMEAARTVTHALNGELLDESGSTLSIQRERYMREEIIQFEHSVRVA